MIDVRQEIRDFTGRRREFGTLSRRAQRLVMRHGYDALVDRLVEGANDVRNEIITSMQNSPPAGRMYRRGGKRHFASLPGKPPRPDSGGLLRSILMGERAGPSDFEVEVGSIITNPPYPVYLEEGTGKMAPRPWLGPAYTKHAPRVERRAIAQLRKAAADVARKL